MNKIIKAYLTSMTVFGPAIFGTPIIGVFLLSGVFPPVEVAFFFLFASMLLSGFYTVAYYAWDRM